MKKLYTLLSVVAISAAINAQTNLIENGNLETWTSDTEAENFGPTTAGTQNVNAFLTKEAVTKHGGSFSARQQSVDASSSTQWFEANEWVDVIAGHSYTISYWYLDNSTTAKTRIWSSWLNASSTTALPDDAATLRFDDEAGTSYSTDSPNWVHKTLTLTAPAAATRFRFQIRTYREATGAGGGYIYYDDLSFIDNSTTGIDTQDIAGLKLFPNPLTAGNTLNITSNNNADKAVAIFDILGKQVFNGSTLRGTVNTSNLTAGVYIVKITEGNETATRKLIVQ